jgi:uncharacterized protein YjiS (DUF1127 family)
VRAARRNASASTEALWRSIRRLTKHLAALAPIFSSTDKEKTTMPTFDIYLPPKAYATWRPKHAIHPLAAAFTLLGRWIERARQRQALAALSDYELRDIGITRTDAAREAGKPFWK